MEADAFRELKALEELSVNSSLTQRHLAQRLEVALGLTNLMIRRLVKKGFIKVVNIQKNRVRYLITPKGIAEKTRLTYEYMEYSLFLYRRVREVLTENLRRVVQTGGAKVIVFGRGEITEIAYLTLKELGLDLTGVVDDRAVGTTFLGVPVIGTDMLPQLSFDCGVVSTWDDGPHGLQGRVQALGIPDEKLIIIEQRGSRIRALPRGLDR